MKKRKMHGLFGTNKRKVKRGNTKKIELEDYEDEYDGEEYAEEEEYEDEADYIEDSEEYEDIQSDDEDYVEVYDEENDTDEESDEPAEEYSDEEYDESAEEYENEYDESEDEENIEDDDSDYEDSDEDEYDVGYAAFEDEREERVFTKQGIDWTALAQRLSTAIHEMTALDAIVAGTGVVLLVAAIVAGSMIFQTKRVEEGIAAIVPVGTELSSVGVVGESGLLAMADARLNWQEEVESEEVIYSTVSEEENGVQVSVSFESVERDLKIRFTDASTGELITGTAFEVTLTNSSSGNQMVLTDDDMDGIIYATSVKAGTFKAVVTSTELYHFPTTAQLVTVKDKVEYVVINVQDEVKSEAQVNVAAEDTQQADAAGEEVTLTDTVEWVESTKTLIGGSESYLLVDKTTIQDPSTLSAIGRSLYLFDGLNVTLDQDSITLTEGDSATLAGKYSKEDSTEENEYSYEEKWESSDSGVVSVESGKVTANKEGTAKITYTVTKTTITTTTEETTISAAEYKELEATEQEKCTEFSKDKNENPIEYVYKKSTDKTITETQSATCTIIVEAVKVTVKSATLEISRSADTCTVGQTVTVAPTKLVYTKSDESTETKTSDFPTITWSSSDTSIATVDSDGTVKGVKAGKVTITGSVTVDSTTAKATTDITITEAKTLAISLDKSEAYIGVNKTTTLTATVSNYQSDSGVTWTTSDATIATVDEKGVVTGLRAGSVTITATTNEKDSNSKQLTATCKVTVNSDATSDTATLLKDKNGNQIYIKKSDGTYREAVYADYFAESEFYIKTEGQYAYTGWQTINGKTYYYDKNGTAVTGEQIIQGVTYNFGSDGAIQTSVNGATFGIDVSRHNGTIDWNAVKSSGVDYVIIRCGYRGSSTGALITDQNFQTNIKGATAAGLKVGVYVFSQAINEVEAVKEASLAVSLVKGYNLTYPIFIDTESSGGRADSLDVATRTAVVNAFCQTVKSAGYQAGIYASKSWFNNKLNMSSLSSYRIWLAQYAATPTYSGRYDMWQYSSKGTISGINGKVDLNLSYLGY